jgi:hypothetical protein
MPDYYNLLRNFVKPLTVEPCSLNFHSCGVARLDCRPMEVF